MLVLAIAIPLFVIWGSFLNFFSHRLIRGKTLLTKRSACPNCRHTLAWFDLIPLISWIMLHGKCRYCKKPISWLYPLIEIITPLTLTALLVSVEPRYFFTYFIFFSALIVTIRSDLEIMLISRFVSFFLIPLGLLLSITSYLPLTIVQSFWGAVFGYAILWLTSKTFYWITKKEGIGQGDIELLAFIGSFTGISGAWISLFIGSLLGSVIGIGYLFMTKRPKDIKIPFGPFLAAGASALCSTKNIFCGTFSALKANES